MDEFVEFYTACDPLLIPQAVQEVIDLTRQRFGQVMHELLYEPDAHWFRCLTTRANKEKIYQFLVQLMCNIASEEIDFTVEDVFEGMPFFSARTIAWHDYFNCHEVQFKFDDEFIYPIAFATFPYRGVWDNFATCRWQTLSSLLNQFSCIFGTEPLHQFSLIIGCTISHNLRGDVVFLLSHDSMQNIQNGRRALDSLVDACVGLSKCANIQPSLMKCGTQNKGLQLAQNKKSLYYHLIPMKDTENMSFRFSTLQDLGLFNKTCDVRAHPKRASVLRTAHLTGRDNKITRETRYPDVSTQVLESYYHEIMHCRLATKDADVPGAFLQQSRIRRLDPVGTTAFGYRIDAWRNSVIAQRQSSIEEMDTKSSAAPMSDNNDDLIDFFSIPSEVQEPQRTTATAVRCEARLDAAMETTDWLSDEPLMMGSSSHLNAVTSLSSQRIAGDIHPADGIMRNMGTAATLTAANLKSLIRVLLIAPNAVNARLEIGRIYFASQPSRKADSLLSRPMVEKILNGPLGIPPVSNFSCLVSTNLLDLRKITHIKPSPNAEWHMANSEVYYRIVCTAYGEKPFIIHFNASKLEFYCSMPEISCVNVYIHRPQNAWDLGFKAYKQEIVDDDLCEMGQKAVNSMKITHDSRGNPVIEVMDLTRFGGMINDITIRYSSTLRCSNSHDASMTMFWNQPMQRKKGLIRHEPSDSAGNTWLWEVGTPLSSRHSLSVSFASEAVKDLLQDSSHIALPERVARLEQLEFGGILGSLCQTAISIVSQIDDISPDPERSPNMQKHANGQAGQKRAVGNYEQGPDEEEFW